MSFFDVDVQRTQYTTHIFRVEAKDREEAEEAALLLAGGYDFHNATYSNHETDVIGLKEYESL